MDRKWILTREKLPPECISVLVYIERDAWKNGKLVRKKAVDIGWHVGGSWHVDMCTGVVCIAWMPLPKPPLKKTWQGGQDGRRTEAVYQAGANPA